MRDNKTLRYAAPVLVLGLAAAVYGLLQANKPEPEKREDAVRPITVFVERIESSDVSLDVITQGEVRSRITVDLVAQVSGRVVHVSDEFMEGGTVTPDEALVLIEDTDYQLALDQSEARVAEARVGVELALADADVARKQLRGTPNPSDLALKKPQVAEAKAMLKAAEADLEQARINLERTRVSLPFAGRLSRTYVDLGQYVTTGTALGSAFATDRVEVRLPISYDQLAALALPIGYVAKSGAGLPVEFSARVAGRDQEWRGELLRLDASIDSDTRLLYAIAEVEDPYGASSSQHGMPMAVGLYVNAKIRGRQISNAVRIPRGALRAGNTVYVLGEDGQLEIRDVHVTHSSPVHAVIADGLESGEQIIVSTIRNPIPGMALRAGSPDSSSIAGNEQVADGQG